MTSSILQPAGHMRLALKIGESGYVIKSGYCDVTNIEPIFTNKQLLNKHSDLAKRGMCIWRLRLFQNVKIMIFDCLFY